jgi:hypothetical protein
MTTRKKWSKRVTERSNALDLDRSVFTWKDPRRIARSLKRSAEHSHRRKSEPYRSAMSMLVFYINRAGKNLPASRRRMLERAKDELRDLYHRRPHARKTHRRARKAKSARR